MIKYFPKNLVKLAAAASLLFYIGCSGSASQVATKQSEGNGGSANVSQGILLDTVKAGKFDTGKMWTFDNPPVDYFEKTYGFRPSEQWLEKARKGALRFASYCSASFVSEDGLVMTNHHCGRESVTEVTREGEDLHKYGFYATTLADERKVDGLYVDQLVLIQDITKEVQTAMATGNTDEEKVLNKNKKIDELIAKYKKETGLQIQSVTLYNGGKYSIYGYKRYNDVRLVFAPEDQLGFFGGDYDNFTYPRYNLDCTFFRVYDADGKPLKTENFFKWSPNGASEGEAVFVVGNPGRTNRLHTVAQLEYYRDIQYPATLNMLNGLIELYSNMIKTKSEKRMELQDKLFSYANSQKVYVGLIKGLNDPVLMARKKDFEKSFKAAIDAKPELKAKYGHIWDAISQSRNEMRSYAKELSAYSLNPFTASDYFLIARDLISYAKEMQKPVDQRSSKYKGSDLDTTIASIFPNDFDKDENYGLLKIQVNNVIYNLGQENELVKKLFGGRTGDEAVKYMISNSSLTSKEGVESMLKKNPDEILGSNDPFIYFLRTTSEKAAEMRIKDKSIKNREEVNNNLLGQAIFEIYGTSIPPDATFTLRISDGVVKGYEYNGTKAPAKTTYYGLYDRYRSFNGEYPWNLPEKWQTIPSEFNLETPMNFISTNDIIGGNSGSPVINKNLEVVGLAFDGNIESLPGQYIFTTESNRCVNVASEGMVEAIKDMYKAQRLSDELTAGKIVSQDKAEVPATTK